jgi:hypothetical protein
MINHYYNCQLKEENVAIVRCSIHPVDLTRDRNHYINKVYPVGYPNTAAICGKAECTNSGYIYLSDDEVKSFYKGERYFNVHTYTVKVKVENRLFDI